MTKKVVSCRILTALLQVMNNNTNILKSNTWPTLKLHFHTFPLSHLLFMTHVPTLNVFMAFQKCKIVAMLAVKADLVHMKITSSTDLMTLCTCFLFSCTLSSPGFLVSVLTSKASPNLFITAERGLVVTLLAHISHLGTLGPIKLSELSFFPENNLCRCQRVKAMTEI